MTQQVILVASGILRKGERVLLVQQQGAEDLLPTWALPGGVVQDGELLFEALEREVREETGLAVIQVGELAYIAQQVNPSGLVQSLAFVFEVPAWSGALRSKDPDGLILKAGFTPIQEGIQRLKELPWRAMREPALAYLSGEAPPGKVWSYRADEG